MTFDLNEAAKNLHDLQKVGEAMGLHDEPPFRKVVEWLHQRMAAAQNLPYEEGDVCLECADAVRDELQPLMEAALKLGGSPRKVGEDGQPEMAEIVELLGRIGHRPDLSRVPGHGQYDGDGVKTLQNMWKDCPCLPDCTPCLLKAAIVRALARPSSVPVGEQKQEEGV